MGNEIYCRELAHAIVEAKKSHELPAASWRPREVGVYLEPELLRADGIDSSLELQT